MVGSIGPRVLQATLPHVAMWNAWHAWFGNTPAGLAAKNHEIDVACHTVGRDPSAVSRTAAIMVQAPGGTGRVYGDKEHESSAAISGGKNEVAVALAGFASSGLEHAQLVVDPITVASIEWLGGVLEILDRD